MVMTKEDRIANLAKARAAKKAKFQKELEEANKPIEVAPPVETTEGSTVPEKSEPSTVTTEPSSLKDFKEITLESLDSRPLEVCIADVCWKGKEITITEAQHQRFVSKGNPDFSYDELVAEVSRILKEGGYIFRVKELLP